ncbi:MAG: radical SAM/SPASM domain-containing protein, partial [Acidobacteriota bacterium]
LLRNKKREYLSPREIADLIARARKLGLVNITFTGGEPLLEYDKLTKVLELIPAKDYLIHIQTNATLLTDQKIRELKKLGVDKFVLSWDPYHDVDNWDDMLEHRSELVRMIKGHGLKTIAVAVAARNAIYTPGFQKMIGVTRALDVWLVLNLPVPLGDWLLNSDIVLGEKDKEYVRDLARNNYHVRLDFDLNLVRFGCPAFTERFHVNAYGDIQPCTFSQVAFGNVREDDLAEVRAKGLKTKTFNTYLPYCPPAEDKEFIGRYWEAMNAFKVFPLPSESIFDERGLVRATPKAPAQAESGEGDNAAA